MSWPWDALDLPGPSELSAIRQAYAEKLKRTRPDENPDGFQRLRNAYQAACRLARQGTDAAREESESVTDAARRQSDGWENAQNVREWDFERLFMEGEAEERGRRFQKLQRLRRENQFRYDAWEPLPTETALDWLALAHALSLTETLAESGADGSVWNLFCQNALFLRVKRRPDFVFSLEALLKESPEIPESACETLFRAYEFDAPPVGERYRPLYELLKARIPKASLTRPAKRGLWRSLPFALALILIVAALNLCADFVAAEDARARQVREWLREDFGRDFIRVEQWRPWAPLAFLDTETALRFHAAWDGPRDTAQGKRGYAADYAQARMSREITAFADQWHYAIVPRYESRNADWRLSYLQIPLTGAGEGIAALGNLLSAMKTADWHKEYPPDFRLYIGWQSWSFYEYDAQTGEFDAPALRDYYERFFGADLCRIALRATGTARTDMGNSFLLLPETGTAQVENRNFFQVEGLENPGGRTLYHYLLSADGAELFCVPGRRKVSELTLRELRRMDGKAYEVKGFSEPLTVFHASPEQRKAP